MKNIQKKIPKKKNIKNNLKREGLDITNVIEAMEQLKNKYEFTEVFKKIITPAQLLHNFNCPSHQHYYSRAFHRIVKFIYFYFCY